VFVKLSRAVPGALFITTLITAYKRPSLFYVPQHPGRHMNVLQDLVHYMEREIRQDGRWFLEFASWESSAVTFPRFRSAMRLREEGGGDRQHARHTPGTCHGGNIARLTSLARAWPIKGNPACLRQRQTLVNSRKQNNPTNN